MNQLIYSLRNSFQFLVLVLALALSFVCKVQAQTWTASTYGTEDLYSVTPLRGDSFLISGRSGTLALSVDGGSTWTAQALPSQVASMASINEVSFIDNLNGWLRSNDDVYTTSDGGSTWLTLPTTGALPFSSIEYLAPNFGYIARGEEVWFTTQPAQWSSRSFGSAIPAPFFDIAGDAATQRVAIVGQNGKIFYHQPGSSTWQDRSDGTSTWLGVDLLPNGTNTFLVVVGVNGAVRVSYNGGQTWQNRDIGSSNVLYDVDIIDYNEFVVVGANGSIRHTTNGGSTYTSVSTSTSESLFDVKAGPYGIVAVGRNGVVVNYDPGSLPTLQLSAGGLGSGDHDNGCTDVTAPGSTISISASWNSVSFVDGYELQLRDATADTLVYDSVFQSTFVNFNLQDVWYFSDLDYRVRCIRNGSYGPWSNTVSFTLESPNLDCPSPVTILAPLAGDIHDNGCVGAVDTVDLYARWETMPSASLYNVRVFDAATNQLLRTASVSAPDTTYTGFLTAPLPGDSVYYTVAWYEYTTLRPTATSSTIAAEPVGTDCPVQLCADLVNPTGTSVFHANDTIKWNTVPGATAYQVNVANSATSSGMVSTSVTDTFYAHTIPILPFDTSSFFIEPTIGGSVVAACDTVRQYVSPMTDCWDLAADSIRIFPNYTIINSAQYALGYRIQGQYEAFTKNISDNPTPAANAIILRQMYISEYPTLVAGHFRGAGGSVYPGGSIAPGASISRAGTFTVSDTTVDNYFIFVTYATSQRWQNEQCDWSNDTLAVPIVLSCRDEPTAHNYSLTGVPAPICETCDDGILNGDETEIDCGGALCSVCLDCPTFTGTVANGTLPSDGSVTWDPVPGATGYTFRMGTTPGGNEIITTYYTCNTCTTFSRTAPLPTGQTVYIEVIATAAGAASSGCIEQTVLITPASTCWDVTTDSVFIETATMSGNGIQGNFKTYIRNVGFGPTPNAYGAIMMEMFASETPQLIPGQYVTAGGRPAGFQNLAAGAMDSIEYFYYVLDTMVHKHVVVVLSSPAYPNEQCSTANDTISMPIHLVCRTDVNAHNYDPGQFPGAVCETCDDGMLNGDEVTVDCGGAICPACPTCPVYVDDVAAGSITADATFRWEDQSTADAYILRVGTQPNSADLINEYLTDTFFVAQNLLAPNTTIYVTVRAFQGTRSSGLCTSVPVAVTPSTTCWDTTIDSVQVLTKVDTAQGIQGTFNAYVSNQGIGTTPSSMYSVSLQAYASESPNFIAGQWASAGGLGSIGTDLTPNSSASASFSYTVADTSRFKYLLFIMRSTEPNGSCTSANDTLVVPIDFVCRDNATAHNYDPSLLKFPGGVCETCDDGILNGDETAIDCGGALCAPCPVCPTWVDAMSTGVILADDTIRWNAVPGAIEYTLNYGDRLPQGFGFTETLTDTFFVRNSFYEPFDTTYFTVSSSNGVASSAPCDTASIYVDAASECWDAVPISLSISSASYAGNTVTGNLEVVVAEQGTGYNPGAFEELDISVWASQGPIAYYPLQNQEIIAFTDAFGGGQSSGIYPGSGGTASLSYSISDTTGYRYLIAFISSTENNGQCSWANDTIVMPIEYVCRDLPTAHNYQASGGIPGGICETCDDGILNGDEEYPDCGGAVCNPCVLCPPATGSPIALSTQAEIDAWVAQYPYCDSLSDALQLHGASIVDLSGFSNLREADGVSVRYSSGLTSLAGLQGLRRINGELRVTNCTNLADVSALDSIEYAERISFGTLSNVSSLPDFTRIDSLVNGLSLSFCYGLTSLSGLDSLTYASIVQIQYSNQLSDLAGLNKLESVPDLTIANLNGMTSIIALQNLNGTSLQKLRIANNPLLDVCNEPWLCDVLDAATAQVTIENNGASCSDIATIAAACGINNPIATNSGIVGPGSSGDWFGASTAISADGNRIAVAAINDSQYADEAGSIVIYEYSGTGWTQLGDSIISTTAEGHLGYAMDFSADGQRLIVSAPGEDIYEPGNGEAFVLEFNGTNWVQLGQTFTGDRLRDYLGYGVAISGSGGRIAIGIPAGFESGIGSGLIRIYDYDGATWQQVGATLGTPPGSRWLGTALDFSHDGMTLVASGTLSFTAGQYAAGHVMAYAFDGTAWNPMGQIIQGTVQRQFCGQSVAIDSLGQRIIIGCPSEGANGYAEVYDWTGTDWQLAGPRFEFTGGGGGPRFGYRVALDATGLRAAVSTVSGDLGTGVTRGTTTLYDQSPSGWTFPVFPIAGLVNTEWLGHGMSLSANGRTLLAGAPRFDNGSQQDAGRAMTFDLPPLDSILVAQPEYAVDPVDTLASPFPSPRGWGGFQIATFGARTALDASGCRMIVSHPTAALGAGGVVAYHRSNGQWAQQGNLVLGTGTGSHAGAILSIAGNGHRYAYAERASANAMDSLLTIKVMEYDGMQWVQLGQSFTAQASDTTLTSFGESISLDFTGGRIAIGSPGDDANGNNAGSARVYELVGGTWMAVGSAFTGSAAGDQLGYTLDLDGNGELLLLGEPGASTLASNAGRLSVYMYDGSGWNILGSPLEGTAMDSLLGSMAVIAADGSLVTSTTLNRGASTVSTLVQTYVVDANGLTVNGAGMIAPHTNSGFGESLALSDDGQTLAISIPGLSRAPLADGTSQNQLGRISLFERVNGSWASLQQSPIGDAAMTNLGASMALSGNGEQLVAALGSGGVLSFEVLDTTINQTVVECPAELYATMNLGGALDAATGEMSDALRAAALVPTTEPSVILGMSAPDNVGISLPQNGRALESTAADAPIDWVYLELRNATDATIVEHVFAGILLADGRILDGETLGPLRLDGVASGDYFLAATHRNHLGVRSSVPVTIGATGISFDFSDATQLFGTNPLITVGGTEGLVPGDADGNGTVNAVDLNAAWRVQNGQPISYPTSTSDFNLDGTVNAVDLNQYWRVNNSRQEEGM